MKKFISSLIISLVISVPAFAQPASQKSVKELLAITKTEQLMDYAYSQLEPMMNASFEQALQGQTLTAKQQIAVVNYSQELAQIIKQDFAWSKVEPEFITIYADIFTQDEVNAMIDFYKTPAGQSTIDKMPVATEKMMQLIQKQMIALMPKISTAAEKLAKDMKEQ